MPEVEVLLPKMGESVAEATIMKWVKNEGEEVEADEPIIEIATDKVDSEVPAPEDGVLVKQLCNEGDVVEVGQPIAIISTEGEGSEPSASPSSEGKSEPAKKEPVAASNGSSQSPQPVASSQTPAPAGVVEREGPSGRFYSPLVRNIAREEGIGMEELESIEGSGKDGRVTKKDILNYIPNRSTSNGQEAAQEAPAPAKESKSEQAAPKKESKGISTIQAPPVSAGADDDIIEMDRMRKLISEHMVMSKHVSPHVTSYVEADLTNIVNWRNKWKKKFEEREGEKLTFTPIFIEAIVKAIKEMPMVNISTDGTNIIKRKHINIGMAAALPSGNLIVPVIHDAD